MRVIAGTYRSRLLRARVPPGTRPTSDRLRETLFNILGPRVIESVFLDAYAGTGAVGIEAISRGARSVYFVDRSPQAVRAIRSNLNALGVGARFRILGSELESAFGVFVRESVRFGVVSLDPPYDDQDAYATDLVRLGSEGLVEPGGCVVAEHSRRVELPEAAGRLHRFRTRRQGASVLTFYEAEGS